MIERKSAAEIETMARAGRVVADTLALPPHCTDTLAGCAVTATPATVTLAHELPNRTSSKSQLLSLLFDPLRSAMRLNRALPVNVRRYKLPWPPSLAAMSGSSHTVTASSLPAL